MGCWRPLQRAARFAVSTTLEGDDQSSASYKLPIGDLSADILVDIDDRVATSSGMCSQKVSKLVQYLGIRSREFYRFEGEYLNKTKALNRHVMELTGLRSFDNLNMTDVIWSSMEAEKMEDALRSIVEVTSWMDLCDEVLIAEVHR